MIKKTIYSISLILCMYLVSVSKARANPTGTFAMYDSATYRQYMDQRWDSLIITGNLALADGFDYYYLRARLGRAYFETANYTRAVKHFYAALRFSENDVFSLWYLQFSLQYSGRLNEARYTASKLYNLTKAAENKPPLLKSVYIEGGPSFINGNKQSGKTDLDGTDNIFGESDVSGNGYYAHTGLNFNILPFAGLYLGYSNIGLQKHHRAMTADSTLFRRTYDVREYDLYISMPIYAGHHISIVPAFRYTHFSTDPVQITYDYTNYKYNFDTLAYTFNDYVYSLATTYDAGYFSLGLTGTWISQNGDEYGQLGMSGTIYPLGNMNLYTTTTLLQQVGSKSNTQFVFNQVLGFRPTKKLWFEADFATGPLRDMVFSNGFVMYNTGDDIDMRAGLAAIYTMNSRITLSARYQYFKYSDDYYTFTGFNTFESNKIYFNKQMIIGGITWNF